MIDRATLSNFASQLFLSNVAWALSRWECVTHFFLDTLDRSWVLCITWLLIDGNISQRCPATLLKMCSMYHQPEYAFAMLVQYFHIFNDFKQIVIIILLLKTFCNTKKVNISDIAFLKANELLFKLLFASRLLVLLHSHCNPEYMWNTATGVNEIIYSPSWTTFYLGI